MAYPPLGAQLIVFSQQPAYAGNPEAMLDAVMVAGFGAVECGLTIHPDGPERSKALLDARGLKVTGVHSGVEINRDEAFRAMEILQTRDLCISGVGGWNGTRAEVYREHIAMLNALGEACVREGIYLHYHNHAYEFAATDEGPTGMELIMAEMDAQAADLAVDVAWVHIGGLDPAAFLVEHAASIGYIHLKDYVNDRHWVALGQGVVPLPDVMQAIETLPGVRWAVYEQDTSDIPAAESCALSHTYLVDTFGYS
ncbi:MAG: sugar phosphate isomerase/epimerase family protein [Anaerolineae bacterium]